VVMKKMLRARPHRRAWTWQRTMMISFSGAVFLVLLVVSSILVLVVVFLLPLVFVADFLSVS
jgi:hypothetical protein